MVANGTLMVETPIIQAIWRTTGKHPVLGEHDREQTEPGDRHPHDHGLAQTQRADHSGGEQGSDDATDAQSGKRTPTSTSVEVPKTT